MSKWFKRHYKILLKALIVLLILVWLGDVLVDWLTAESTKDWVASIGFWGPAVVMGYIIFSHVLAPLLGSPAIYLSAALFGITTTLIFLYIASMISSAINFYIARKFGRKWVKRLVGAKAMKNVDKFTNKSGVKFLILSRLFGISFFDLLSYAWGLTNIKFKTYYLITIVFTLIPNLIITYFFKDADLFAARTIGYWFGLYIVLAIIFSWLLKRSYKKN